MMEVLVPRFDIDFSPWRNLLGDWEVANRFYGECPDWMPATDIAETDMSFVVTMELPGIDMTKTDISFNGGILTIRGEKHKESGEGECCHRSERYEGNFSRTIRVPDNVQSDKIDATYKDGILKVTLPKTEESMPRKIEVH